MGDKKKALKQQFSIRAALSHEQQNFEFIIENAGISKFRTLKLYIILKGNFKSLYYFDIIIPKANRAEEFAPLIEIAERELENLEDDENNEAEDEEYQKFI